MENRMPSQYHGRFNDHCTVNKWLIRFSPKGVVLGTMVLLSSCASFEPGADRIVTEGSLAEVGPLKSAEEQPVQDAGEVISQDFSLITELEASVAAGQPLAAKEEKVGQAEQQSIKSPQSIEISPSKEKPKANDTGVELPESSQQVVISQESHAPAAPQEVVASEEEIAVALTKPRADPDQATKAQQSQFERSSKPKSVAYGRIAGRIKVTGSEGALLENQSGIVTLESTESGVSLADIDRRRHFVDMKDKIYTPRYLTIQANDVVSFVNKDPIKHNVFSSSDLNAFDLGTFGAKKWRDVVLSAEGVVKVYCNIHPEMASFIKVDKAGISTVASPADGQFEFNKVPVGNYRLSVWNVRGSTEQLIRVTENSTNQLQIDIDTTNFQRSERINKFGLPYSTNTTLFNDEFY